MKKNKKEMLVIILAIIIGVASVYTVMLRAEQIDRGAINEKSN